MEEQEEAAEAKAKEGSTVPIPKTSLSPPPRSELATRGSQTAERLFGAVVVITVRDCSKFTQAQVRRSMHHCENTSIVFADTLESFF